MSSVQPLLPVKEEGRAPATTAPDNDEGCPCEWCVPKSVKELLTRLRTKKRGAKLLSWHIAGKTLPWAYLGNFILMLYFFGYPIYASRDPSGWSCKNGLAHAPNRWRLFFVPVFLAVCVCEFLVFGNSVWTSAEAFKGRFKVFGLSPSFIQWLPVTIIFSFFAHFEVGLQAKTVAMYWNSINICPSAEFQSRARILGVLIWSLGLMRFLYIQARVMPADLRQIKSMLRFFEDDPKQQMWEPLQNKWPFCREMIEKDGEMQPKKIEMSNEICQNYLVVGANMSTTADFMPLYVLWRMKVSFDMGPTCYHLVARRLGLFSDRYVANVFFSGPCQHGLIILGASVVFVSTLQTGKWPNLDLALSLYVSWVMVLKKLSDYNDQRKRWGEWLQRLGDVGCAHNRIEAESWLRRVAIARKKLIVCGIVYALEAVVACVYVLHGLVKITFAK